MLIADFAGQYEITATWDKTVNRGSRILRILVNAVPVTQANSIIEANGNATIVTNQNAIAMVSLSALDVVTVDVEQNTDSTVVIQSVNLGISHI